MMSATRLAFLVATFSLIGCLQEDPPSSTARTNQDRPDFPIASVPPSQMRARESEPSNGELSNNGITEVSSERMVGVLMDDNGEVTLVQYTKYCFTTNGHRYCLRVADRDNSGERSPEPPQGISCGSCHDAQPPTQTQTL